MEVQQQQMTTEKTNTEIFRVKAKWKTTDDWPGYTKDDLHFLFYKVNQSIIYFHLIQ